MLIHFITIPGNPQSEDRAAELMASLLATRSTMNAVPLAATTPDQVDEQMAAFGLSWNHPATGTATIEGLKFHAYSGDHRKRMACALSHFRLWQRCAEEDEPLIVAEDDCVFLKRIEPIHALASQYGMISFNDPCGATRKSSRYHVALERAGRPVGGVPGHAVIGVPWVDNDHAIPQGLPGHSCYLLKPWFARELIDKAREVGLMPQDALACKQWFPGKLGASTIYFSRVSGRRSLLA